MYASDPFQTRPFDFMNDLAPSPGSSKGMSVIEKIKTLLKAKNYDGAAALISREWPKNNAQFFVTADAEAERQADDLYAKLMKASRESRSGRVLTVTPGLAQRLLQRNDNNRPIGPSKLSDWLSAIDNDDWEVNGEPIIVANTGDLNDGQHRLLACLVLNKPFNSFVNYGVDRNTRLTVDVGRKRTPGDRLSMRGVTQATAKAAMAKHAFEVAYGREPHDNERDAYFVEHQKLFDEAISKARGAQPRPRPAAWNQTAIAVGVFFLIKGGARSDALGYFLKAIKDGANLPQGNSALAFRNTLSGTVNYSRSEWTKALVMHYNLWRKNIKAKGLQVPMSLEAVNDK